VPQLFTAPIYDQINGGSTVTKSGASQPLATIIYEHELLVDSLTQKQVLPYRAQIPARSMT